MKFEKQRIIHSLSNKIELSSPDYLTFRNNPTHENTGRTLLSQQLDFRSADKYTSDHELQHPNYNFKKSIRNVRSQDKYRQIHDEIGLNLHDQNGQTKISSQNQRTDELKAKMGSLTKSIKKATRTQATIDKQIEEIESVLQQNSEYIKRMQTDIEELSEISQDNVNNYNNMLSKIQQLEDQAKDMVDKCLLFDKEIGKGHEEMQTVRSRDGSSHQSYKQMLQGMKEYQAITQNLTQEIASFDKQIYGMQLQLEELHQLDDNFRNI